MSVQFKQPDHKPTQRQVVVLNRGPHIVRRLGFPSTKQVVAAGESIIRSSEPNTVARRVILHIKLLNLPVLLSGVGRDGGKGEFVKSYFHQYTMSDKTKEAGISRETTRDRPLWIS